MKKALTEIKKKICKSCGVKFIPFKTTDTICSTICAVNLKKAKESKKNEQKKVFEKQNRTDLLKLAQSVFNTYIRERDKNEKCFCCGESLGKNYQAGHAFSAGGHSAVRFNENNVHGQRFDCNNWHRETLLADMMAGCEKRIGNFEFIILREKAYENKQWTSLELKNIIEIYRKKTKGLIENRSE